MEYTGDGEWDTAGRDMEIGESKIKAMGEQRMKLFRFWREGGSENDRKRERQVNRGAEIEQDKWTGVWGK